MTKENEFNYPCPICGYKELTEKPITRPYMYHKEIVENIFNCYVCVNCAAMFDKEIIDNMKAKLDDKKRS